MKNINLIIIALAILMLQACKPKPAPQPKENKDTVNMQHLIMAVLFHQQAAELKAIYYQTFNWAKRVLAEDIKDKSIKQKRAIILDIDETVLDNSPFEAVCIKNQSTYPVCWEEWVNQASAKAIPGAIDFLNHAASNDVEIFYVSNRKVHLKEATIKNLKQQGFPYADDSHVLLREKENSKENRRLSIAKDYHIVMLFGDNLADFTNAFDDKTSQQRDKATDSLKNVFGEKFIILPNAMYGDWENALFGNKKLKPEEQQQKRNEALIDFNCK